VRRLYSALVAQDASQAIAVVQAARGAGVPRDDLFDLVYVPAMGMLGASWAAGELDEIGFAQAGVTAEQVTSFVIPEATSPDSGIAVVVGCVEGERHAVMRNIIVAALREAGHRVADLGVSAHPAEFLDKCEQTGAAVVIACAETVGAAQGVRRVREMLDASERRVALLVAGGPFVADVRGARELGANGVASGAESALRLVRRVAVRLAEGRS
jgi:methanogenic corrinoid protein MtbC1